jgi:hypothetical protein
MFIEFVAEHFDSQSKIFREPVAHKKTSLALTADWLLLTIEQPIHA